MRSPHLATGVPLTSKYHSPVPLGVSPLYCPMPAAPPLHRCTQVLSTICSKVRVDPGALDDVPLTDTFWIPTLEFRSLAVSIASKLCPIEDRGMWNKSKVWEIWCFASP